MVDITMCEGKNCPMRENCYRYKARPGKWQSQFNGPNQLKSDGTCDLYWPMKEENQNESS